MIKKINGVVLMGGELGQFLALKAAMNNWTKRNKAGKKWTDAQVLTVAMRHGIRDALRLYIDDVF